MQVFTVHSISDSVTALTPWRERRDISENNRCSQLQLEDDPRLIIERTIWKFRIECFIDLLRFFMAVKNIQRWLIRARVS